MHKKEHEVIIQTPSSEASTFLRLEFALQQTVEDGKGAQM